MNETLKQKIWEYDRYVKVKGIDETVLDAFTKATMVAFNGVDADTKTAFRIAKHTKDLIESFILQKTGGTIWDLEEYLYGNKSQSVLLDMYYEILLLEAQHQCLDSYFLYLERKRVPKGRFYLPKREQFLKIGLTQALQQMLDDEIDILSISMPPGTGKTTLEKFFNSGIIGWFPEDFTLFFSHSGDITRMYYDSVYQIVSDKDEYTWSDIFPGLKVTNTNAKMEQFNVGKYKPFPSLQCTSIGSSNAGKVRASKYLLCDDLIGGIEVALNKNSLDKLWNIYSVDARQRKIPGCKEIHIATRWSVHDVIGRIERIYENSDRVLFISVPDIDEQTGKSNFDYKYNGFGIEFFRDQELAMDEISYKCLYKNQPIEREGLLYHEEDVRRFASLPIDEPDAILSIIDTKTTGIDYMFMPIFYQYGQDYYLVDCICDDSTDFDVQISRICDKIISHKVQKIEFESNAGGSRLAYDVEKALADKGHTFCTITTRPTETNKETRIIVNADWVKKQVLFRHKEEYTKKEDYGKMMSFLFSWSVTGKNKFDDVPDGMANFRLFVENLYQMNLTKITRSPF